MDRIRPLPTTLERLLRYDFWVRIEDVLSSPDFNAMPMIDYYLSVFGLNPADVSDAGLKAHA